MVYPESTSVQLTRPSGSGNLAQNSTGHSNPGFALTRAARRLHDSSHPIKHWTEKSYSRGKEQC